MHKIRSHHIISPVGPTPGHVATYCHIGTHVAMTPHRSKEAHSRQIRSQYTDPRAHFPTETGLKRRKHPQTNLGTHLAVTLDENRRERSCLGVG
jgi:hypothetical protein